jgi:hypothetical protein
MLVGLGAVALLGCAPSKGTVDVPGPVEAFDPMAALPRVLAFAGAGAQLVSIKAVHVRSNGTIDLGAGYHRDVPVKYSFVRPSGATEDPSMPVGARSTPSLFEEVLVTVAKPKDVYVRCSDGKGNCMWRHRGMEARRSGSDTVGPAGSVPLPACGIERLWQEARGNGAPADAVATVAYGKDGFSFEIPGTEVRLRFDATCKVKKAEAKKAAAPPPQQTRWAGGTAQPIGIDSDRDGAEDLLGPTTRSDGPDTQLFVSLFDGKTFTERYHVGPFGSPKQADNLHIAAAGQGFVVRDPKGEVHLFKLADGELVNDFPFTNGTSGICGPPAAETVVAVNFGQKDPFIIDTRTGSGKIGKLPAWCKKPEGYRRRISESYNGYGHSQAGFRNLGTFRHLQVPAKTRLRWAFADGNDVIGYGCKMGEDDCQLIGFDLRGNLRYVKPAAPAKLNADQDHQCDLAFGRLICRPASRHLVVAVDAATGDVVWSMALPQGGWLSWPGITASRVWVPWHEGEKQGVYAIDAATGKLLGTAGM